MPDSDDLDQVTRQGLRILAQSTKKASGDAQAVRRLERAADTGRRADYVAAEEAFNEIPPDQRQSIGSTATQQAKIVRERQRAPVRDAGAEPKAKPGPTLHDTAREWKLGGGAAAPKPPTPPAAAASRPHPMLGARPQPQQKAAPAPKAKAPPVDDADEPGQNWDWQKLPDDPVMRSRKADKPKDEFEELRRQMLDSLKRRR
jgi:hypothetical protein